MSRHQRTKASGNGTQRNDEHHIRTPQEQTATKLPSDMPPEMKAIAAMAENAGMAVGVGVSPETAAPEQETSIEENKQQITDPAVLVVRIPGESPGQYNLQIVEMNGMDPFAVPAVLKLAAKVKNLQLGLKEED